MGNLVFQATLGGQVNLVGPNTASTYNINVPSVNGNLVTTGDTGTVTNTMLAGSIANAKLTNSSVTVGSTAISLGSAATTVTGLTLTSPTLTSPNITTALTLTGASGTAGQALVSAGSGNAPTWSTVSSDTVGFKNRLFNGSMVVDQRNAGSSQTFTAGAALAYSVDRWYGYCTGANVTGQQVAGTYASSLSRYQFTGAASVTAIGFGQRIEQKNSFDLANTTVTLSCYISNSLLTTVTWTAYYANTADAFGTLASPTRTQISTGTFTVTSTRTQYSTNISIPSAATTGIEIVFTVGAQTSGTWIIDSVQLEKGSTATSFDYRPYGTELQLCQRYFQSWGGTTSSDYAPWSGLGYNSTTAEGCFTYLFTMRSAPSLTQVGNWYFNDAASDNAAGTLGIGGTSLQNTQMRSGTATGITQYRPYVLRASSSASRIQLSAEL